MSLRTLHLLFALSLASSCAQVPAPAPSDPTATPPPEAQPVSTATTTAAATATQDHSWKLTRAATPESLGPGLTYLRHELKHTTAETTTRATLHLVRFESAHHSFRVVDRGNPPDLRFSDLADAMEKNSCLAGCNGGFFHPDFRPAGLVIADGQRINRFENAKLLSGLLLVDSRGPRLLRRAEFKDHPGITQLIQAGPFLVDRGNPVGGLSTSPARTRTFVMTDGAGQWAIGTCNRVSLADMGNILADLSLLSGFKATRALNLDGGSSSSLYFERSGGGKSYHRRSFKTVRNYLGITKK